MAKFNWNTVIDKAIVNAPKAGRHETLKAKAENWVTCAVGSQCSIIPRGEYGMPNDFLLSTYGVDFYHAIKSQDYVLAKTIIAKIEQRSALLIDKIKNPK